MNYLINTRTPWNEPPRARHQFAFALAKKNQVFFVAANKKGIPRVNIIKENENLYIIQPYWFIDYRIRFRVPLINELYQIWLFNRLKKEFTEDIRVINFDHTASLIAMFFKKPVYYCNDNFIRPKTGKVRLISLYHLYCCEKIVAKNCLFCISVSSYLQKKIEKFNHNSFVLLLGAPDVDSKFVNGKINIFENKITITYVGWLSKLNREWVVSLAKGNKYHVQLIGPFKQKDVEIYTNLKNIEITGPLEYDLLYQQIAKADLTIAPYEKSKDVSEVYSMPNKFWLFLAFGKAIVTCNIKNLIPLPPHFVYKSKNYDEFISNIEVAISNNDNNIENARSEFAKKNTWDSRIEELMKIYENYDRNI